MERKLASIQIVADIQEIPGADMIEVATINGWKLIVKKNEFKVGDKAIYFEIDSFLPIRDEFEFLRKSSFKKIGNLEGFKLKTIKLRGQVSQGLLLPLNILQDVDLSLLEVGDDLTEILGVLKFEAPIPAQLSGVVKASFPSFIPKTDEERIQNLTQSYENYKTNTFYLTEKLDGSSATFYFNNGVFGVCSRNIDLLETEDNSFWKAARELDIESKLTQLGNFSLQGELIGEGIQGNPYKIKGHKVYFFNLFDINKQEYCDFEAFTGMMKTLELDTVPILDANYILPDTVEELLQFAESKSILNSTTEREGVVIRSHNRNISFKAISNKFLLKQE